MINLEVEKHLLQILLVICNEKAIEHDFFLWRPDFLNGNNNPSWFEYLHFIK